MKGVVAMTGLLTLAVLAVTFEALASFFSTLAWPK